MKTVSRFVGTTILGGVLFLTPIVVLGIVLSKAYDFVRRGLQPLMALIPQKLASGPTMTAALTILLLGLMCFLAGLLAQTLFAQRIVSGLEATVLSKVPGYEYLKQAGTSVLGLSEFGRASGRARRFRRLLADRGSDRLRRRRLRRGVHSQFPEPDVGISFSHRRRPRPPGVATRAWRRTFAQGCVSAPRGASLGSKPVLVADMVLAELSRGIAELAVADRGRSSARQSGGAGRRGSRRSPLREHRRRGR